MARSSGPWARSVAARRAAFPPGQELPVAIPRLIRLIRRFAVAVAADVDERLATACRQARATSSLLHQRLVGGDWFDAEVLDAMVGLRA